MSKLNTENSERTDRISHSYCAWFRSTFFSCCCCCCWCWWW